MRLFLELQRSHLLDTGREHPKPVWQQVLIRLEGYGSTRRQEQG